jgi:hypothetical protein
MTGYVLWLVCAVSLLVGCAPTETGNRHLAMVMV